jgi:hypothetical protein
VTECVVELGTLVTKKTEVWTGSSWECGDLGTSLFFT